MLAMAEGDLYVWKCKCLHADQSPPTASERSNKKTKKKNATPITVDSFDSDNEDLDGYSSPRVACAKKSSDIRRISFDMDPEMYVVEIDEHAKGCPRGSIVTPTNHTYSIELRT